MEEEAGRNMRTGRCLGCAESCLLGVTPLQHSGTPCNCSCLNKNLHELKMVNDYSMGGGGVSGGSAHLTSCWQLMAAGGGGMFP
ncbi:rCG26806 [Rattus norvegicus]|uniref:RCG26806 n=1 Tax=Rattus norvegicus TaxID=10116 RepID=A6HMM8_RAT|nr:rCG26806 [Rattus norvegicus]